MDLKADGAGVEGASCEGAVVLKMLQDSEAPYFKKTITAAMLRKFESVVIPKKFCRTYDDVFHTPELCFTGPSGHTVPIKLKVRYSDIVYLNRGWLEFVRVNGFQAGDELLFWMVKKATFRVFICSQAPLLKESESDDKSTIRSDISSEGVCYPKVYHRRGTAVPKCATSCDPAEVPVYGAPHTAEVEAGKKSSSSKKELVKHPNLSTLGPRFPHFYRKLSRNSLLDSRDVNLELPSAFVQEHGHKFQAHVFLLGPSGRARLVNLRLRSNGRGVRSRVQIREGWRSFALENGFKLGDLLLFSLGAVSKFIVQSFPSCKPAP